MLSNLDIANLLADEAESAVSHRRKALASASRAALAWEREARDVEDLESLPGVGASIAARIERFRTDGFEPPEIPSTRQGFKTLAWALSYENPLPHPLSDLHTHTNASDGTATLAEMVGGANGYRFYVVSDHSAGQPIPSGIGLQGLRKQRDEIEALESETDVLQGLEMNLNIEGSGDTDSATLATLDLVIGAFHSKLRETTDQTDRYLRALLNADIQILAHPSGRKFGVRDGLKADWHKVADAAAHLDKALEFDCNPSRQDLRPEALQAAKECGCRISLGSDAHSTRELGFMRLGLATLAEAGIPQERIVNYMTSEELKAWVSRLRNRA